jgi:hypothetical protein
MKKYYSPNRIVSFYFTLTILFVFLAISGGFAQTFVNESWQNQEGQPSPSVSWTETVTHADGDVFVVGNSQHASQGTNIFIVKYDNNGVKEWETQFNGASSGNDFGAGIIVDAVQNIYVIGTVFNAQDLSNDYAILRYDNQGVLQWQYIYDAYHKDDIPTDIAFTPDGDLLITGSSEGNSTQRDYLTLKLDDGGNLLWQKRYDYAQFDDGAVAIKVLSPSKYVITGASQSSPTSNEVATITYSANGNIMGIERQSGVMINTVEDMTTDDLGNIYLTGYADNANGDLDYKTVKMDSDLVVIWTKTHNEANAMDKAQALVIDATYNVYVTGTVINGAGVSQIKTIKYNASGNIVWQRNFSTSNTSAFFDDVDMILNGNDELGITASIAGNETNVHTMGYSIDGDSKWSKTFSIIGNEKPSQITATANGFNVTGISGNSTKQYFVISYSTYDRPTNPKLGGNGLPDYIKNQIIVDFSSAEINTANIDNEKIGFGGLSDFLSPDAVSDVADKIGEVVDVNDLVMTRIFTRLKSTQTTSITRSGDKIVMPHYWSTVMINMSSNVDEAALASAIVNSKYVNTACLNSCAELSSSANDSWYGLQYSLQNATHSNINVEGAWDIATGRDFVKVGVVDMGINYEHEDFQFNGNNRIVGGYQYYLNHKYDTVYNGYTRDATSHGTKVAGIIGATRNNTKGIAGIAGGGDNLGNGVSLYNLAIGYVQGGQITIPLATIIEAITDGGADSGTVTNPHYYGTGFGLDIMNHSYGNFTSYPSNNLLQGAVRFAFRNGVTNVAARGNKDNNANSAPQYPACFEDHLILNVGGTDANGNWWNPGGSTGAAIGHDIDVAAPAQEKDPISGDDLIYSTAAGTPNSVINSYATFGATSAATPHVTGIAALLHSYVNQEGCAGNLSMEDVEYLIEHNAVDVDTAGYDIHTGHGLVDAQATLEAIEMPKYRIKHFESGWDLAAVKSTVNKESGYTDRFFDFSKGKFNEITSGTHPSRWYKINAYVPFTLEPNEVLLDNWLRLSETNTYSSVVGQNGHIYNERGVSSYAFNNSGSVFIEGYAYEVIINGGADTVWFPEELNHNLPLTLGYSLYTQNDQAQSYSYPCNPLTSVPKVEMKALSLATLYPNPASGDYTGLKFVLANPEQVTVNMYDLSGKLISTIFEQSLPSGTNFIKVPVHLLSNGVYLLEIKTNSGRETLKFIRSK